MSVTVPVVRAWMRMPSGATLTGANPSEPGTTVSAMRWATRNRLQWIGLVYFAAGQVYAWQQFLTLTPGRTRTLPEIVVPAVAEIVVALLIACYVILRARSLVWVLLATLNAIVLLVVDFASGTRRSAARPTGPPG